ncbi:MAG: hypothetical protein V6Z89_23280 [Desulfobacter sp.]
MDKSYYIRLRNQFTPEPVKLILILESPPISGKYFYDETGKPSEPLFSELMKFLKYNPADKKDGLSFFQKKGILLMDVTYKPVNHLKGKLRNDTILSDFDSLTADLRDHCSINSTRVILIKANICKLLEPKLLESGFPVINQGVVIPFPSTGQQKRFHAEIMKIIDPADL